LTTLDADAARVDSLILDALRGVAPSATAKVTSPRPPATPVASPGSAEVLRAVLEDLREPVVLVIDDVDSVGPVLTDTVIRTLVSTPSEQITLVLIGTQEPPLALARQRLAGRVATIGGADLRFTVEEIAELARVVGRATDPAEARSLAERTGGWPAAVPLVPARDGP
jgi:LuxR family maltose regulon positive regulatory protein